MKISRLPFKDKQQQGSGEFFFEMIRGRMKLLLPFRQCPPGKRTIFSLLNGKQ